MTARRVDVETIGTEEYPIQIRQQADSPKDRALHHEEMLYLGGNSNRLMAGRLQIVAGRECFF